MDGNLMGMLVLLLAIAVVLLGVAGMVLACALRRRTAEERGELSRLQERVEHTAAGVDTALARQEQVAAALRTLATQTSTAATVEREHFDRLVHALDQQTAAAGALRREVTAQLSQSRETLEGRLDGMRTSVAHELDTIRATVDEKLAATLNDRLGASFKQVSEQLEAVYKGLGEMQSVAGGVNDLKRVLANVKTRGILGEVQLGAILADMLAPEQYVENVATKPGATERVEFAVKLPQEGGEALLLPIDAKFPGDTYEHLREAVERGEAAAVDEARKQLEQRVRQEAKDIAAKYLAPPHTTNFGILFLPFEGLYAEVVDRPGLVESLQRDYRVAVAGPSTMAAILNSLQMSYQTFAFQQRADEIQRVLAAVKAEFPKYQAELRRALKQIETAGRTVDGIIHTRTNVIERKLRDVTALEDDAAAAAVLGIETAADDARGRESGADADADTDTAASARDEGEGR